MKSNSKTIQPRKPSPMRELLWTVYKWTLISLCAYSCYSVLHLVPEIHFGELLACTLITGCFTFVIYCHKILKKKVEQPDFDDDAGLFLYHIVNLGFYGGLHLCSVFLFDFISGEALPISDVLFSIVVSSIIPTLYILFFLVDYKAT